ncbi:MAG: hypothetical protein ACE5QF_03645 [Thermoplasmata archaeon]
METDEETDMAGAISGIIALIVGWYLIYYVLDLVFIKKSVDISQRPYWLQPVDELAMLF